MRKKSTATSVYVAVLQFAQINVNPLNTVWRHVLSLFDGYLVIFPGFVYTLYGQQDGL